MCTLVVFDNSFFWDLVLIFLSHRLISLIQRLDGGKTDHDEEAEETTQRPGPDTRQAQKTRPRYPSQKRFFSN